MLKQSVRINLTFFLVL